jgi:outer membrane protein assembly factor BamB
VATARGEVLAYAADGKPLWRAQVSSDVLTAPLVGRGLVIVRSTDQRIVAFEADSGKRRWNFSRSTPPLTLRATADLSFAGDSVLAGMPGGRLIALSLANGAVRWDVPVSEPKGTTEVERLADVIGPVAVDRQDACAASYQGRISCMDSGTGTLRWTRSLAAGAGVAIGDSRVFGVDAQSHVLAHARDGGASLWRNSQLANRRASTPLSLGREVVVGDFDGYVHWLSADSGEIVGRVRLDGAAIVAAPQAWAGSAIVLTQGGALARIASER